MFVLVLTYVRPLEEVDRLIDGHKAYLARNYAAGRFIVSGRREPRTGGLILARAASRAEIDAVIAEDPFASEGVAHYEVIEFLPGTWADGFAAFIA
jgi:uncharacterized protein YciI